MKRTVEVAKEARELVETFRAKGYSEQEIMMGFSIAIQVAPISKAIEENPKAKRIMASASNVLREGLTLLQQLKDLKGR